MQNNKFYSVFDVKSGTFNAPFLAVSDGYALRMVADAALDINTLLAKHPEDFALYALGEFCDTTGLLMPYETPERLADVITLLQMSGRGAAVGGVSPLKSQSAGTEDSGCDVKENPSACEASSAPDFKFINKGEI